MPAVVGLDWIEGGVGLVWMTTGSEGGTVASWILAIVFCTERASYPLTQTRQEEGEEEEEEEEGRMAV